MLIPDLTTTASPLWRVDQGRERRLVGIVGDEHSYCVPINADLIEHELTPVATVWFCVKVAGLHFGFDVEIPHGARTIANERLMQGARVDALNPPSGPEVEFRPPIGIRGSAPANMGELPPIARGERVAQRAKTLHSEHSARSAT